jgi:hypothetical protein
MKTLKSTLIVVCFVIFFSSCYQQRIIVGSGPQGKSEVTEWNHYLIFGLAPVNVADVKVMAGDAENYEIWNRHSFVNGLIQAVTFGIYTPTMTTVYK